MMGLTTIQQIAVWALPLLFAITVHEVAHGWMARRLGDPTAEMMGRLTLNPIKHVDPVGTVLVPLVLLLLPGNFIFGWAKPVPVTWQNLNNPKRDMAIVALAGPGSNLLMAVGWGLVAKIGTLLVGQFPFIAEPMIYMGGAGILINIILAVLNLLPLPPLDGGRVMTGILPGPLAYQYSRIEPYGFFILLALLVTGILGGLLWPVVQGIMQLFYSVLAL